jgi:glycopeptide antibiotics resistance protein
MLMAAALLTPGDSLPKAPLIPNLDKVVHLGLFAVLTFLWSRVVNPDPNKKIKKSKFFTNYLVFGIIFAVFIEYLQHYVPNRSFDLDDIVANVIGGILGIICFYILHKRKSRLV